MFFNPIKERHRLRKEINRLLSKGTSNIYLKVTIEKKKPIQNSVFKSLKRLSPGQFLWSSNSRRYHWIVKLLVATSKSEVWKQNFACPFYHFYLERKWRFNPVKDGFFRGCSRIGGGGGEGGESPILPKICHTFPTIMKLDTVIPQLKIYKSCDTSHELCWHKHFFTGLS